MRRFLLLTLILAGVGFEVELQAQTKEINPNVQWRVVRIQDMQLASGEIYEFSLPMEKGYDYMCNLSHNKDSLYANISVFDLQDQPIKVFSSGVTSYEVTMNFTVTNSATHKLVLGLIDPAGNKGELQSIKFALIRRPQI